MQFLARLTHEPDNCWMRGENRRMAREWIAEIDDRADEHDVDLQGEYVTPSEHTFYLVMEADDFESVTGFLGPPLLQDHDADVAPVLPLEHGTTFVLEEAAEEAEGEE